MSKAISQKELEKAIETALMEKQSVPMQSAVAEVAPHQRGSDENADPSKPQFEVEFPLELGVFFTKHNISVFLTGYKSNLVFCLGAADKAKPSLFYSRFPHPLALNRSPSGDVWVGCNNQIYRLCEVDSKYNGSDDGRGGDGDFTSVHVIRQDHFVGKHDVHHIYSDTDPSNPLFLSTSFSSLCHLDTTNPGTNVNVIWKPPFISEVRAEDRCHLNGVCYSESGDILYATSLSESDIHDGWRSHREAGGVLIDVQKNEVILRGLSMPHNPTMYKGQLWLIDSGTGRLGTVDTTTTPATFKPRVFIPGFARGLQFVGNYALVGSSLDRHCNRFTGLKLGEMLTSKKTEPVCGMFVVDLLENKIVYRFQIKGNVHEIYDVLIVPGRRARVSGVDDTSIEDMTRIVINE